VPSYDDTTKAAFFYGMGIMGAIAGVGLGSTAPNKVALLLGLGSLWYANTLNPVVDVTPRPELQESIDQARSRIPFVGTGRAPAAPKPTGTFQFDFGS